MKILTVRMDRMGDVLLSLPALDFLKKALPEAQHFFAVSENVISAIRPFLEASQIEPLVTSGDSLKSVFKATPFDAVLILNAPSRVFREAFLARVPIRFGMFSSFPSFLFLNGGLRQRRSRADRSEGLFNGQLAEAFGNRLGSAKRFADEFTAVAIPTEISEQKRALEIIKSLALPEKFSVVHPGMGGSALNLSALKYQELLTSFQKKFTYPLVFSKGAAAQDQSLVDSLLKSFPEAKVFPAVSLGVLRELFRQAQIVVAPSTGPLHLAHYVGTTTLGLFSPVRSHRPLRWQPWGGEGRGIVLTPEVDCPGTKECWGSRCAAYPCMEKTHWNLLLEKAGDFI